MHTLDRSKMVKEIGLSVGFDFVGISKAGELTAEAHRLENWLNKNYHGDMAYMANNFEKRINPTVLVPGAKSVISFMLNYYPEKKQENLNYKVSKYAYGDDYHEVIKSMLADFYQKLTQTFGQIEGRYFVDSAPVMDKAWAKKSGLGWMGKNTNIISPKSGSFFFLAEFISDLELTPDGPIKDYCGTCTRCVDACPTGAIVEPYVVDGSKCISYFTIELKNEIPNSMKGHFDNWVFGCDICQDVCPWNRFSTPHNMQEFEINPQIQNMNQDEWESITEEGFKVIFKHSPIKRTKYQGLKRNLNFIKLKK